METKVCSKEEAYGDKVEKAEAIMLQHEQVDCPLRHLFAPSVYIREVTMPKGARIIGHEHKTEHFNIVLKGKAEVVVDGKAEYIEAPCIFVSKAGVRKVLNILEEMVWATVHPTANTSLDDLEEELITKSDAFLEHGKSVESGGEKCLG
jgi:quercetin dioxygenase-like cupin family protein